MSKSDMIDVSAQLEVQKLQIKILKDVIKDKEREIEDEKKLSSEWKMRAFERVKASNDQTMKTIKESPEYKDLQVKFDEGEARNLEILGELQEEKKKTSEMQQRLKEEQEESRRKISQIRQEIEESTQKDFEELQLEQRNIEHLKGVIKSKTTHVDALQEEKNVMVEELQRLKKEIEKLTEANNVLREHVEDMQESLQQENIRNSALQKQQTEGKEEPFWKKMQLPEGQECIQYFACCNSAMKGGWLYVTTHYVLFETSLKHLQGDHRVVMQIQDIVQLDKRRVSSRWIPGKGMSLMIRTKDSSHLFRSFLRRNEAAILVLRQAQALNHIIITTQDDREEDYFANEKEGASAESFPMAEKGSYDLIQKSTET